MRNERVWPRLTPPAEKSVSSQRVAARLVEASAGSVPTHGSVTFVTGGRSTSLSRAGAGPVAIGGTALSSGASAQVPPAGRPQRPSTAVASRAALCAGSGDSSPGRVREVVVVTAPVRATPTTWTCAGSFQSRSVKSIASSPTPLTLWVVSSCIRGDMHPAYQPAVVSKVVSPAAASAETSADCPAVLGSALASGPGSSLNVRTSAATPAGSAYRPPWQVKTSPSPAVLPEV